MDGRRQDPGFSLVEGRLKEQKAWIGLCGIESELET